MIFPLTLGGCVIIHLGHCERPKGAWQSPFITTCYEIASVVLLPRLGRAQPGNDIVIQSPRVRSMSVPFSFLCRVSIGVIIAGVKRKIV